MTKKKTMIDGANSFYKIRNFVSRPQLSVIRELLKGEEGQFFIDKMMELADRIETMPKTYEQDGKGQEAVAFLHYFIAGMDWYITERDMEAEQTQVFGQADLGYGSEMGYISIVELVEAGAELDLHFVPATLANINRR